MYEIGIGLFNYADHFPESCHAVSGKPKTTTFSEIAQRWLASQSELAKGSRDNYRKALSQHWLPRFGDLDITTIRYSQIAEVVGSIPWGSPKTRNNALISLRQVFDMAWRDELIPTNPTDRIKNAKVQQDPPDPFTQSEADMILAYMHQHCPEQAANYFQFAFYSGCRPEEIIALRWADVDAIRRTARIQRAFTAGEEKGTKTGKVRDIELTEQAWQAIQHQKAHTFLAGDHVFHNPATGKPWSCQSKQRIRYWIPTLKKIGMRYRVPYNCRHTYATMLLMAGCNPAYAAAQMGHSVQVFLNVYARWINTQETQTQHQKLGKFLSDRSAIK